MQFSCTQENLRTALSLIGHIAARQGSLPILSNVLLRVEAKAITLITTNLEVAMSYQLRGHIEQEGAFTANAKLLADVVNLLPKDRVDIIASENELTITCRGSGTKVRGVDAAEFPLVPEILRDVAARAESNALRDALSHVAFAMASSESRPELSGTLWRFEGPTLTIAATDSYRLAERHITLAANTTPKGTSVIVPARTTQELLRVLGVVSGEAETAEAVIIPTTNQLLAVVGDLEVTSRLTDGTYPDYNQIIPQAWNTKVRVDRTALQTAARAASLFARTGVNDIHLRALPKEGQLLIRSENTQLGEHQARIDAEVEGEEITTILNARYLLEGLAAVSADRVSLELTGAVAPVALKAAGHEDYVYVIMPIKQ